MLQIGFRLRDDARNFFHALAQTRDPFFCRREIARDQKIKAVGQALHVNQRIPLRLLQLFGPEDFVIDVLFENSKINVVRAGRVAIRRWRSACREILFAWRGLWLALLSE